MTSIIITAYKEPKTLYKQLQTISYQLSLIATRSEILVASPDKKTQGVVLKYHRKNPCVKLLQDRGVGKPAALNLAFKKAQGDILVLTDGDVEIDKKAILEILKPFKNSKIGAVSGRPVSKNPRNNMFGYWAYILTKIAHTIRKKRVQKNEQIDCSGYLYAIRSGLIKKIPKNTLADDGLISRIIALKGYEITYAPEAKVYVQYPDNFSDWIKQKKRSTGGYAQIPRLLKQLKSSTVGATLCGRPGWDKPAKGRTRKVSAPTKMRGFFKETGGIFQIFKFAQNPKEFFWTLVLIFARIYLWFLILWEVKIKKTPFTKMWQRVESTK